MKDQKVTPAKEIVMIDSGTNTVFVAHEGYDACQLHQGAASSGVITRKMARVMVDMLVSGRNKGLWGFGGGNIALTVFPSGGDGKRMIALGPIKMFSQAYENLIALLSAFIEMKPLNGICKQTGVVKIIPVLGSQMTMTSHRGKITELSEGLYDFELGYRGSRFRMGLMNKESFSKFLQSMENALMFMLDGDTIADMTYRVGNFDGVNNVMLVCDISAHDKTPKARLWIMHTCLTLPGRLSIGGRSGASALLDFVRECKASIE